MGILHFEFFSVLGTFHILVASVSFLIVPGRGSLPAVGQRPFTALSYFYILGDATFLAGISPYFIMPGRGGLPAVGCRLVTSSVLRPVLRASLW